MSALVTHLLVGALVALALRWEWKWVPLGMLLAELPDLDHFFGLEPRVHLHNVFFALVVPLAVLAYLVALDIRSRVDGQRGGRTIDSALTTPIRLAAGAPALMSSHLVLDAFPDFGGSHVALLHPLSDHVFRFDIPVRHVTDPYAWSAMSVAMLLVVGLVALAQVTTWGSLALRTALIARAVDATPAPKGIAVRLHVAQPGLRLAQASPAETQGMFQSVQEPRRANDRGP